MSPTLTEPMLIWLLRLLAALTAVIVLLIAAFLLTEAMPALAAIGPRFVTDAGWNPAPGGVAGGFNILPMVLGTLLVTLGAVLLATPIGLASALFCRYYAPAPVAAVYRRLLEVLAGIPGVIYGFWGLMVLVPLIAALRPPGASILAAILVLTLMILPTVALLSESALRAVPRRYLQAAAGLGLSRWSTITGVALPAARKGIIMAVVLAGGRAIGETLAVVMVVGNVVQLPASLLDPVRTLTGNIALEMGYASGDHRAALYVSGLVLMLMVAALVTLASSLDGSERADD